MRKENMGFLRRMAFNLFCLAMKALIFAFLWLVNLILGRLVVVMRAAGVLSDALLIGEPDKEEKR